LQLFDGGQNGAAPRMAYDHDQANAVAGGGKFDAADERRRHDIARNADDEQVAEALIEDDLSRDAGIGATEDDRKRLLGRRDLTAAPAVVQTAAGNVRRKAGISVAEAP
jgi:hypothetical protein